MTKSELKKFRFGTYAQTYGPIKPKAKVHIIDINKGNTLCSRLPHGYEWTFSSITYINEDNIECTYLFSSNFYGDSFNTTKLSYDIICKSCLKSILDQKMLKID